MISPARIIYICRSHCRYIAHRYQDITWVLIVKFLGRIQDTCLYHTLENLTHKEWFLARQPWKLVSRQIWSLLPTQLLGGISGGDWLPLQVAATAGFSIVNHPSLHNSNHSWALLAIIYWTSYVNHHMGLPMALPSWSILFFFIEREKETSERQIAPDQETATAELPGSLWFTLGSAWLSPAQRAHRSKERLSTFALVRELNLEGDPVPVEGGDVSLQNTPLLMWKVVEGCLR